MRWLLWTVTASLVLGCLHSSDLFKATYVYQDNPAQERIDLLFENKTSRSVCLMPEFWPNQAGKVNQASERIHIVVDQEEFKIASFNTGYCPACVTKVEPGEKIKGFISYADFNLAERHFVMPKNLVLDLRVYNCR